MGKWSRNPLGSDRALDNEDAFLKVVAKDPDSYYFDLEPEEIRQALLSLKVEDIKKQISSDKSLDNNRFVIPYAFLEYNALSKDKDIRALLKDCLNYHAMFSNRDVNELNHIKRFIERFDEIFDGTYDLENDKGLIQAMLESKKPLVNITDDYFGIEYDFSKYLKCGVCGEVFKKKPQKHNTLYLCNSRYKRGSKGCSNKGVPDDMLVVAINDALNTSMFDPVVFKKQIKEIVVFENNVLELHFLDGRVKKTTWKERDNKEQWTLEKRAESRINSMQYMNADDYPLRDKLICGDCGNYYVHKKKKEGYVYVCRTNRRVKTDKCHNVPFKEKDLIQFINKVLDFEEFNKEIFDEKVKNLVLYPNKSIKVVFTDERETKYE